MVPLAHDILGFDRLVGNRIRIRVFGRLYLEVRNLLAASILPLE
jgi:hypothetical protein